MGFIDHQHVHLRPELTFGNRLNRCNLQQFIGLASPVIGLNDSMVVQAIVVGHRGCLVDQRGAVAQEYCTLTTLDRLIANPQSKVCLACPGGGHDQLVLVAFTKALS